MQTSDRIKTNKKAYNLEDFFEVKKSIFYSKYLLNLNAHFLIDEEERSLPDIPQNKITKFAIKLPIKAKKHNALKFDTKTLIYEWYFDKHTSKQNIYLHFSVWNNSNILKAALFILLFFVLAFFTPLSIEISPTLKAICIISVLLICINIIYKKTRDF